MTEDSAAHLDIEVPEADRWEQRATAGGDDPSGGEATTAPDPSALTDSLVNEADLLEQTAEVAAESDDDYDHDHD
jgi:hypothetical protein